MNFQLTAEQEALRRSVREFAEAEIKPHVMEWDEQQDLPDQIIRKIAELGLLGMIFPEDLGGSGMGYIEYAVAVEELARVDPSVALLVAAQISLCANHIYLMGNDDQRRKYVPKLATGEWIGCWSLTEPQAGSDAAGTRTRAENKGDHWLLNGAKTFTTNSHIADVCVATAVTNPAKAEKGISAFIIEKDAEGYRVGRKENKLGMRASVTGEVIFENCKLPLEQILGAPGHGFIGAMRTLDGGRVAIAALSVGLAQGAYEASLGYSRQREQFGRKIAEFQAIQHKLADMATEIEAARLLTYQAGWHLDQGRRVTKLSSMAKLFASEMAVRAANEGVQIFGGYGFVKDYPVEKFYRDVKVLTIGEGTSEIQRMIIARQILKT